MLAAEACRKPGAFLQHLWLLPIGQGWQQRAAVQRTPSFPAAAGAIAAQVLLRLLQLLLHSECITPTGACNPVHDTISPC
jgi:hypothetical protein